MENTNPNNYLFYLKKIKQIILLIFSLLRDTSINLKQEKILIDEKNNN